MKEYCIIKYNSSYKDKLYNYIRKISPHASHEYIVYCVNKSDGIIPSILVIDGNDNIVGCHLHFSTKLYAKGDIKDVAWGHETFLDEEYRFAGLDFVLAINCDNTLGIGYSDINREIQRKLKKNVLMENIYNYFLMNLFFPWCITRRFFCRTIPQLKEIKKINAKVVFNLVNNSSEICVPNNGFWFESQIDYDLIRDKDYLDYRFFKNKVFDYSVYEYHNNIGESCYFVVRPILYRGISTLLLVDYRYYGSEKLMDYILACVKKIALKNHIGLIQTTGGMNSVERAFSSWFCIKRHGASMIHKSLCPKPTDFISITPSDSDVDFNR